jgi:DNA-cytosine methyltransferase
MKVLSLFDGMSCGQLALERLGIKVDKYYASEIDNYAIQVTQANFPNTIQIGDVKAVKPEDYADIDLIICGSPCQGFSFAGKQLAFDDPRSALFFEFIRILKQVKPKYFLLENVRMKKEFIEIISQQVSRCYPELPGTDLFDSKIEPILINSALLSAQSRQRLYWTNIPNVKQPEDLGIVLKDILEDEVNSEFYHGEKSIAYMERGNDKWQQAGKRRADRYEQNADKEKSFTITENWHKGVPYNYFKETKPIKVGMNIEEVKVRKHKIDIEHLQRFLEVYKKRSKKTQKQIATELDVPLTQVSHWFRTDSCFSIPPADLWLALRKVINADNDSYDKKIMEFEYRDGVYETKQRVYSDQGKAPTLTASNKEQMIETKPKQVGVASDIKGHDILKRVYSPEGKSPTLNSMGGGNREPKVVSGVLRARSKNKDGKNVGWKETQPKQMLELRKDEKANSVTSVSKDSVIVNEELTWRKLTPLECERLQTVPDNYTNHVSNTQRYRMLGNGFTVSVIAHILKNMEI